MLSTGSTILVFYKSSKQNEINGWIQAIVVETTEHSIVYRRHEKGTTMTVAYGVVRLLSDNELARRTWSVDAEDDKEETND